jgi:hypothetical protein
LRTQFAQHLKSAAMSTLPPLDLPPSPAFSQ